MNLQGTDVEKLVNAMLKAYPEQCQLEEMVLYRLDENLAAIVPSSNSTLRFIIFKLIQWAEANGTIRDLLCAISEDRPDNSELRTVINNLLITSDWINLLNDSYLTRFHPLIEELKKSSYPNIPNRFGLSKSQEIIEVFQNISHSLESGDNFRSVFITSRDILITIDPLNEEYLEHFCNKINIVLLVMNNSEAQELYSESVFSDYNIELRENFRNLKLQLTNNGVITWVNYYK